MRVLPRRWQPGWIDRVGLDLDLGLDVRRGGIDDGDARPQQVVDRALAQDRLGFGQLQSIVHAEHLLLVFGQGGADAQSLPRAPY